MNAKEQRFADEYKIDLSPKNAAIRAGYSENTAKNACYWINKEADEKQVRAGRKSQYKPELAAYIAEQLEQLHSEKTATAQEVMEYLTSVMRGETSSHVLALCGDGCQEIIDKPPDEKERLKAADLLGKHFGLYTDKLELEAKDLDLHITIDYGEGPEP